MPKPKQLLLLFATIGIIDSAYLTIVHYTKLPLYCPEGGVINCVQVTTSALSSVAGIPIAVAGLVWFIGVIAIAFFIPKVKVARNMWVIFGLGGVAYSIVGQALLGKICEYCVLLDIMIILCAYLMIKRRDSPQPGAAPA